MKEKYLQSDIAYGCEWNITSHAQSLDVYTIRYSVLLSGSLLPRWINSPVHKRPIPHESRNIFYFCLSRVNRIDFGPSRGDYCSKFYRKRHWNKIMCSRLENLKWMPAIYCCYISDNQHVKLAVRFVILEKSLWCIEEGRLWFALDRRFMCGKSSNFFG